MRETARDPIIFDGNLNDPVFVRQRGLRYFAIRPSERIAVSVEPVNARRR